jgi:hypothetical protein
MRKSIALAALAAALALPGCASMPGGSGIPSQILDNLDGCKRMYTGGTGLGATFSFHIECQPSEKPAD